MLIRDELLSVQVSILVDLCSYLFEIMVDGNGLALIKVGARFLVFNNGTQKFFKPGMVTIGLDRAKA